jgi:16S rRNA processing protein RimM
MEDTAVRRIYLEDRLRVGVITSPHGVKGEVKVFSTTDDLNRFKKLKNCFLTNGRETIEAECTSCKFLKNMAILKFAGFDNINDVEKFRQYDILVNREDAVELEAGEFFICDVIGSDVYDQNGTLIGQIQEVLETKANHVFVVKNDAGEEKYIPVVKDWVTDIDTHNKVVKVHVYGEVEAK